MTIVFYYCSLYNTRIVLYCIVLFAKLNTHTHTHTVRGLVELCVFAVL